MTALLVILGAAVGAPTRLLVSRAVAGARGTLVVNLLGSLLLGAVSGLGASAYALLGVGFCGALTTFSTFAVEVVRMPRRDAVGHAVLSVAGCLLACAVGLGLTRA